MTKHNTCRLWQESYQDKTATLNRTWLSILTATTIRAASANILVLCTYWPISYKADENTQSLTAHTDLTSTYRKRKQCRGSSLDWIKGCIAIVQSKHLLTIIKHKHTSRILQCTIAPRKRRHQRSITAMGNIKRFEEHSRKTISFPQHIQRDT